MRTLRPWAKDGLTLASIAFLLAVFGCVGSVDQGVLPCGKAVFYSLLCIGAAGVCLLLSEIKIK